MAGLAIVLLGVSIHKAHGKCSVAQQDICRKAAVEDGMKSLPEGGQCMDKQYVQFTHVCTVSKYAPYLDFCCCVHEQTARALCCRYHHHWNYFRCTETEDTVASLGLAMTTLSFDIALPTTLIIAGLIVVVTCYFCYCCCLRHVCQLFDTQRHALRHHQNYAGAGNCCLRCCSTADLCCYDDDQFDKTKVTTCLYPDEHSTAFKPTVKYSLVNLDNSTPQKSSLVTTYYHGNTAYHHDNTTHNHGNALNHHDNTACNRGSAAYNHDNTAHNYDAAMNRHDSVIHNHSNATNHHDDAPSYHRSIAHYRANTNNYCANSSYSNDKKPYDCGNIPVTSSKGDDLYSASET